MLPVMRWADRTTLWRVLQSPAIPGGDTARQDALNCASINVCEGFRCQAKFLQPPETLLCLLHHTVCVGGTFQIVGDDVYAQELEAFHLLHCGPVDVGLHALLFHEVQDHLLCFVDVIFLTPHSQSPHLLPLGCLVIVGNHPTAVMLSANWMIELEACLATQSWVNREYRRGLSTHPCGTPVFRISEVEELFPTFITWGGPSRSPEPSCTGQGSDPGP